MTQRRAWRALTALSFCLWCAVSPGSASAQSEREQLEEEMFGGVNENAQSEAEEPSERERREEEMFAQEEEETPSDSTLEESTLFADPDSIIEEQGALNTSANRIASALLDTEDRLAIGGFLFMQLNQNFAEDEPLLNADLSAPTLLDLFVDARPNDRLRLFASGRVLYDYTQPVEAGPSPLGGFGAGLPGDMNMGDRSDLDAQGGGSLLAPGVAANQRLQAQLAQLWVKFDVDRKVYFTIGRQRIRWGSGRFWNPTDFLNQSQINPIALFDQRLGVDLIKAHVPLERLGWNLYAVAMLDGAREFRDVGGALRAEILVFNGELALSGAVRRQQVDGPSPFEPFYAPSNVWPQSGAPLKLGVDYSHGFGRLELRVETALTRGEQRPFYSGEFTLEFPDIALPEDLSRQDEWIIQSVVSADLTLNYLDDETLIVAAEYFYNQAGYSNDDLYLWLALQGGLTPLYLGRHYAALALLLPSPGSWNDSSFTGSVLGNISDGSLLGRLDYSLRLIDGLSVNAYVMRFFGQVGGEFKFRVEVPAIPGQTDEPLVFAAPSFATGLGLRLNF